MNATFLPQKDCIIGLSPMDDITDLPFRTLCKEMGADLLVTEFIASEALNRDAEKSLRKMGGFAAGFEPSEGDTILLRKKK